jgi:hypothetical protein
MEGPKGKDMERWQCCFTFCSPQICKIKRNQQFNRPKLKFLIVTKESSAESPGMDDAGMTKFRHRKTTQCADVEKLEAAKLWESLGEKRVRSNQGDDTEDHQAGCVADKAHSLVSQSLQLLSCLDN